MIDPQPTSDVPSAILGTRAGPEALAIEEAGKLICPRCSVRLPRPELIQHLWLEHHLVLDGRSARDPWRLIEDWLEEYCQNPNPRLLARCRAFARRVDPEEGIARVQRLFLAHRVEDEDARRTLLAEAQARQASLCPRCFTLVFSPEEIPAWPLDFANGLLHGKGYRVEISEHGFFSQLEVEATGRTYFQSPEPDRWLSPRGAELAMAGPLVLLALLVAFIWPAAFSPLVVVALLLLVAFLVFRSVQWIWQGSESLLDRTVNYAWTLLVPRLETDGFTCEDLTFLAGLALTSVGHGRAKIRADNLQRVLNHIGKKVAVDSAPVTQLAALWRLVVEDRGQAGEDAVQLVTAQIGQCFDGHLPLSFAENLLAGWESPGWTPEQLTRLRILLCKRAFEAGFEVRDLLAAGISAPALGEVMRTSDAEGMCRLRLLWSLRPQRPWDALGSAVTVFDLARRPNGNASRPVNSGILDEYPDLLLALTEEPQLLLCGRGIVFQDELIPESPKSIEVKAMGSGKSARKFKLILGDWHFELSGDPMEMVPKLERWFRYHFGEFLPQARHVLGWRSPGLPATFRLHKTVACPECRREMLPRIGDLGVLVEEPEMTISKKVQITSHGLE
jgi:hypothetical protein